VFWGNGFSGVASDCLSLEASPGFDWRTDGASLFHAEEDQTSFRRMVSLSLSLSLSLFLSLVVQSHPQLCVYCRTGGGGGGGGGGGPTLVGEKSCVRFDRGSSSLLSLESGMWPVCGHGSAMTCSLDLIVRTFFRPCSEDHSTFCDS